MSQKVEKIKQFNTLMETFLTQISPLIGTYYKNYFSKLIKVNSIMPIKKFYLNVIPFKNKIINKDESYFKEPDNFNGHDLLNENNKDRVFNEIIRLKDIYNKLDETNQSGVWVYFQALLVLSEEYHNL